MDEENKGKINIGNSAETAKAAAKATAHVATGDVVGAGFTLLSSSGGRRIIAGILIFSLLLPLLFLYALPVMMFETVVSFFKHFIEWCKSIGEAGQDAYDRSIIAGLSRFTAMKNYFEAATGRLIGGIADAVVSVAQWAWGKVKGLFKPSNKDTSSDESMEISDIDSGYLSDDAEELYITDYEDAQRNTLKENLESTKDALKSRMDEIVEALESVEPVVKQMFRTMYQTEYSSKPQFGDSFWTESEVYGEGYNKRTFYQFDESAKAVNVTTSRISDSEAAKVMSIYTIIRGASIKETEISEYQKWLGYEPDFLFKWISENLKKNRVTVDIGLGQDNPSVIKWAGTCLPQYLYDQAKFERDVFGKEVTEITGHKSCAAMDLLITVKDPQITSTIPTLSTKKVPITVHRKVIFEDEDEMIDPSDPRVAGYDYVDGIFYDSYTTDVDVVTVTYRATINVATRSAEQILSVLGVKGTDASVNAEISDNRAQEVWENLPSSISVERKTLLKYALSLVGKVKYFWGGKSYVLGDDPKWGKPTIVTATGSPTTGTTRPFGMDCSGFVDWAFYNQSVGNYILSNYGGVKAQHQRCTDISWSEAYPGDLVFYPGDSHIGIVCGWDSNGNVLIVHCASGSANGVVITGRQGFQTVGRPEYFASTTSSTPATPAPSP